MTQEQGNSKQNYGSKYEKVYIVGTRTRVSEAQLNKLRNGIVITTLGRRKGAEKRTRVTLPCIIHRIKNCIIDNITCDLQFHLREGRNRQIRKMLGALGHKAMCIHRIEFARITLAGLSNPGDILELTPDELSLISVH